MLLSPDGVRRGALPLLVGLVAFALPVGAQTPDLGANADLRGKQVLPPDNPWNQDISGLPVDPNSATLIASIGLTARLHPDFGSGKYWTGKPYGIPYIVVPGTQPLVPVRFDYASESDPGPYPIPANAPIEGGNNADGDRHVIVIDRDRWKLHELFYAFPQANGSWQAGSGAVFPLNSNALRPLFWTSADAAGLPIFPGLVRYDEVVGRGAIRHALRFTVARTRRAFVAPARHFASSLTDPKYPPMGMRVRLKASYDISKFPSQAKVILTALKKYGMIVADNGSNWFLSGAPDARWDDDQLNTLKSVPGSAFEVVRMGDPITDRVSTPTGLRAVAGPNLVTLSWNAASGASSGYVIKRSRIKGGPYENIKRGVTTTTYADTAVTGGLTYYYVVAGENPTGQSAPSAEVVAVPRNPKVPAAPTNLTAAVVSATQVNLTWKNTATNATLVRIQRSTDNVQFTTIATPGGSAWSSFVANLTPSTTYYFRVRTENADGVSAWSNVATAKTKAP
ncbi:MAG: fibronectin type III domain-containing protein [Capsulimonadales bacterium]|nr:fibronectin type III domain-containing protein [Capsulimonadales bacterium]